MGGLPLLKVDRCCFCTRKLKVACLLIVFWSMLAISHSMRMLVSPTCSKLYTSEGGRTDVKVITNVMWILFAINLLALCSSFFYFIGLFLGFPKSADLFMIFGFLSAIGMLVHGILNALHMHDAHCNNPSDSIAHFIYFMVWIYFIVIVNSHRDNM